MLSSGAKNAHLASPNHDHLLNRRSMSCDENRELDYAEGLQCLSIQRRPTDESRSAPALLNATQKQTRESSRRISLVAKIHPRLPSLGSSAK